MGVNDVANFEKKGKKHCEKESAKNTTNIETEKTLLMFLSLSKYLCMLYIRLQKKRCKFNKALTLSLRLYTFMYTSQILIFLNEVHFADTLSI